MSTEIELNSISEPQRNQKTKIEAIEKLQKSKEIFRNFMEKSARFDCIIFKMNFRMRKVIMCQKWRIWFATRIEFAHRVELECDSFFSVGLQFNFVLKL